MHLFVQVVSLKITIEILSFLGVWCRVRGVFGNKKDPFILHLEKIGLSNGLLSFKVGILEFMRNSLIVCTRSVLLHSLSIRV